MGKAAALAPILAIAIALTWERGGIRWNGWPDFLVFVGFCGVLLWLVSSRNSDAAEHESADQSIAFRLGKTLNRIRRRKSV